MLKILLKISILSVLLGASQNIFASDGGLKANQQNPIEEQIFIFQGDNNPVLVVPESSPEAKSSKFMRMPNLNEEDIGSGIVLKRRKSSVALEEHSSAITNKIKSEPQTKPLHFSAAKIAGKVRLPRVNFAKVGIPMEVRDEMPSLDFTGKSLSSGGL